MKSDHKARRIPLLICLALILAMLIIIGFILLPQKQANSESQAVIDTMEELVPYFGSDNTNTNGSGRDPLPVMSINGVDIVGAIEIPSLDLRAPVTDKSVKKKYFARWAGGSPVKGKLRLMGGRNDVFSHLSKGKPGEKVIFTDIDGVRYEYTITTQFHLKDWAKADYDLMLCYQTDADTKFVLGCTRAD